MGDSTDGSSIAAQSAQASEPNTTSTEKPKRKSGFFSRIIGALSPSDAGEVPASDLPAPTAEAARGMLNLRRLAVEDVAIPKVEIIAVPTDTTKDELVRLFRDSGLTRLPVFEGTLDTPKGFVHLKDLALKHGFNGGGGGGRYSLKKMLRPLLYVPPSMPIGVLLQKMQSERRHMALVIDEYGGVDGLVTIEDLIEQVVGEIEDEHDIDDAQMWVNDAPGAYLALAKTPLDEFEAEIGTSLTDHAEIDSEEIDTLGGLVFMLSGRVPVRGEVVRHPDGCEFEVVEADPRRIKRLRVRLPKVAPKKRAKAKNG